MANIEEIDLSGFEIVNKTMFMPPPRRYEATCTLGPSNIGFSKQCAKDLNECDHIRMDVNYNNRKLVISPTTANNPNGIPWVNRKRDGTYDMCKMESVRFFSALYKTWQLDVDLRYRSAGRIVAANGKIMLLFDFNTAESWQHPRGEKK